MDNSSTIMNFQDKNNRKIVSINAIKYIKKNLSRQHEQSQHFSQPKHMVWVLKRTLSMSTPNMFKLVGGGGGDNSYKTRTKHKTPNLELYPVLKTV